MDTHEHTHTHLLAGVPCVCVWGWHPGPSPSLPASAAAAARDNYSVRARLSPRQTDLMFNSSLAKYRAHPALPCTRGTGVVGAAPPHPEPLPRKRKRGRREGRGGNCASPLPGGGGTRSKILRQDSGPLLAPDLHPDGLARVSTPCTPYIPFNPARSESLSTVRYGGLPAAPL